MRTSKINLKFATQFTPQSRITTQSRISPEISPQCVSSLLPHWLPEGSESGVAGMLQSLAKIAIHNRTWLISKGNHYDENLMSHYMSILQTVYGGFQGRCEHLISFGF